jgi:hypothetical protein
MKITFRREFNNSKGQVFICHNFKNKVSNEKLSTKGKRMDYLINFTNQPSEKDLGIIRDGLESRLINKN